MVLYSRNKEALASRALAADDARRAAATKEATQVAIAMGAAAAGVEMQQPDSEALMAALHRPILQGGDAFDAAGAAAAASSSSLTPLAPASDSPRGGGWLLTSEPFPHRARAASVDGAFVVESDDDDPAAVAKQLPMPSPVRTVSSGSNASTSMDSPRRSPRPAAANSSAAQATVVSAVSAASAVSPVPHEAADVNPFD